MFVLQELSKLRTNKATGLDGISAKLLRFRIYNRTIFDQNVQPLLMLWLISRHLEER